jgi:hypothetical protein
MRKNRLASISVAAATTILTLGGAGCGDLKDLADELLSHNGGATGGASGSTGPRCDYQGKTYDLGASFPSVDGCNACTCDKGGIACTEKACTPPPAQSCEKIPVSGAKGECVPVDQWKIQGVDVCVQRGASISSLELGGLCEDGVTARAAIIVCCKATPANDVQCLNSVGADGVPCTVCTDASGVVAKTDCSGKK